MKNMNDIRALVFREIEKLQRGETTASNLNAITSSLNLVINIVKLELDYAKTISKEPEMNFFEVPIDVNSPEPKGLPE